MSTRILSLCALLLAGCGDPEPSRDIGGGLFEIDGGVAPAPNPPLVDPLPAVQPYGVLTLRGSAEGRRLFVEGSGNPLTVGIEPGGGFCADIPLPSPGTYEISVRVQAEDGQLSDWAGPFVITYDPRATPIPGAATCTGADPAGCSEAFEICGNGKDDDCNSLIDEQDPRCAPCVDDPLEPNDEVGSPRIPVDRAYDDLAACPGDPDWFGIGLETGQTLAATIRFSHAEGDLDLELVAPNRRDLLADSRSFEDVEQLTYTATTSGVHHLHVFGSSITSNTYRLELQVTGQ